MKDEYGGLLIIKFVGLKSKMYSILDENNNKKSTNKGHNAFIDFQEFYDTLFQKKLRRHIMRGIKSKNHNLGTYESNKRWVSCFDDKCYTFQNGVDTLAYGHKDILKINKSEVPQMKKVFFSFFEYIRNIKMIDIEYVKYPPTSIDDIKDEKLKAHLKSIPALIDEIVDKKISEF